MPKIRITKTPSKYSRVPQNDVLGEQVKKKGGKVKGGKQGYPFQKDQGHMNDPDEGTGYDMGGVITPIHVPDMDGNMYAGGGPFYQIDYSNRNPAQSFEKYYQSNFNNGGLYDQNLIGNITNPQHYDQSTYNDGFKKGGWLKGAVNPAHKGYCTPMTKSTCTGHRREFAETMKKHHGFHEDGGYTQNFKQGGKYIGAGPNTDLNVTTNHGISDYNPYIYFKNKNWYITSNPQDASITDSVKPIDRDAANIEAEKGEYIAKPGLTGLYKIGGEKHSQGGTPLFAEGGSFIFSNDPSLSFSKGDRSAFGFKGNSNAKSKNTPAAVLGREVNPKDYNSYIATLEEPKTDRIAKTTAGLMLEKLQQKLGQIAYVQEAKKNDKIPDFAQGTAPAVQPELQNIDEKMSEYRVGGMYPYGGGVDPVTGLPIDPSNAYPGGRTTLGRITPTGLPNSFNYPGGVPKLIKDWKGVGIDMTDMNPQEAQHAMYRWAETENPQLLRTMWGQYGDTAYGQRVNNKNINYDNLSDDDLHWARQSYVDGMLGARTFAPELGRNQPNTPHLPGIIRPDQPNVQAPPPGAPPNLNTPGQPQQQVPTLPYQIKGKMTDSQLSHLGYLGLQAFNINRYYPKIEQVNLPQVRFDKINSQPFINQVNNQDYESRQLAALNPRTANLVGSNIRGSSVDQLNQILGNVANQNTQIANQQNQFNTQQASQQVMANSQFDNTYYNQVQNTNQNFDNERRFAGNQLFSNLNNYQSQADQLAWGLASINRYGTRRVVDPKTGQQYNLPTPLYEANGRGINFNADVANINMATGANRINTPTELASTYQQFKNSGMPDVEAQRILSAIIRARGNTTTGQGPFYMQNPYGSYQ